MAGVAMPVLYAHEPYRALLGSSASFLIGQVRVFDFVTEHLQAVK